MSYAIEVTQVPVRLVDCNGDSLDAGIFLHTSSSRVYGPETLLEKLNDPKVRFLPCAVEETIELVNLDWIAWVEVEDAATDLMKLDELGALRSAVVLHMSNGSELAGEVVYGAHQSNARVSDLVNQETPRFLCLTGRSGTRYVNRSAVYRIVEAGEG